MIVKAYPAKIRDNPSYHSNRSTSFKKVLACLCLFRFWVRKPEMPKKILYLAVTPGARGTRIARLRNN